MKTPQKDQQPPATDDKQDELIRRITNHLVSGGLFNPELAIHDRVTDLLIECREELSKRSRIHTASQHEWKVRYPSEGCTESDIVFEDGSAIRVKTPVARIICDAHNAALAAERKRCDPNEFEKQAQVAVKYYEQQLSAEREKRERAESKAGGYLIAGDTVRQECERLEQQLLAAQAEIAAHNNSNAVKRGALLPITVDLCALAKHDAEVKAEGYMDGWHSGFTAAVDSNKENKTRLIAEVRKPLVDLLTTAVEVLRANAITHPIKLLVSNIDDALSQVKEQP